MLAVGDFDADGHLDVVTASRGASALHVLPGDGAGRFGEARTLGLPGAVTALAAWVSVIVLHEGARYVGGAWMLGGIVLYVVYRRGQDKSLRKRFTIPAKALQEAPEAEFGSILVPVFGDPIDDDIMGTAGRLAAEEGEEGG